MKNRGASNEFRISGLHFFCINRFSKVSISANTVIKRLEHCCANCILWDFALETREYLMFRCRVDIKFQNYSKKNKKNKTCNSENIKTPIYTTWYYHHLCIPKLPCAEMWSTDLNNFDPCSYWSSSKCTRCLHPYTLHLHRDPDGSCCTLQNPGEIYFKQ